MLKEAGDLVHAGHPQLPLTPVSRGRVSSCLPHYPQGSPQSLPSMPQCSGCPSWSDTNCRKCGLGSSLWITRSSFLHPYVPPKQSNRATHCSLGMLGVFIFSSRTKSLGLLVIQNSEHHTPDHAEVSEVRLWVLCDLESIRNSKTFEGSQRRKE